LYRRSVETECVLDNWVVYSGIMALAEFFKNLPQGEQ
jgi:hypothetical protein